MQAQAHVLAHSTDATPEEALRILAALRIIEQQRRPPDDWGAVYDRLNGKRRPV
jgi:hypothetical protein